LRAATQTSRRHMRGRAQGKPGTCSRMLQMPQMRRGVVFWTDSLIRSYCTYRRDDLVGGKARFAKQPFYEDPFTPDKSRNHAKEGTGYVETKSQKSTHWRLHRLGGTLSAPLSFNLAAPTPAQPLVQLRVSAWHLRAAQKCERYPGADDITESPIHEA
jgi:hypothetical protein